MAWVPCDEPRFLSKQECQEVLALFLEETGERYVESSVRHLPIPAWGGNMKLVDLDLRQPPIEGVLWATPFMDDIVRVAAFVVHNRHQSKGYGAQAWSQFTQHATEAGFGQVQLEVKAANTRAQSFYIQRGLIVQESLIGYYASGPGYMMRGPLVGNHGKDHDTQGGGEHRV